jgi:hypothetical protein
LINVDDILTDYEIPFEDLKLLYKGYRNEYYNDYRAFTEEDLSLETVCFISWLNDPIEIAKQNLHQITLRKVIHALEELKQIGIAKNITPVYNTIQPIPAISVDNIQPNQPVLSDSELFETQIITTQLSELKAKLETNNPDPHDNVRTLMKALQSDPTQVTLLTIEQRDIISKSMSVIAGIDLVADVAKSAKKK